jgi:hypothetical protein
MKIRGVTRQPVDFLALSYLSNRSRRYQAVESQQDPEVREMIQPLTEAELLALPASVDLVTAGRVFGVGRTKAYELARAGQFPVKVVPVGLKFRVPKRAILDALGIDPDTSAVVPQPAA